MSTQTPESLYQALRPLQEQRGYFFNADHAIVLELLEQLLIIKDRYGYMACPCRITSGKRQDDKDVLCPCVYRDADVQQYGACYCGLYMADNWKAGTYVPDRRPPIRAC